MGKLTQKNSYMKQFSQEIHIAGRVSQELELS